MATKNPRLNVVLEPGVYGSLKRIAKEEGVSLSLKARDLIREALAAYEDRFWYQEASKREKTLHQGKAISHANVWKS